MQYLHDEQHYIDLYDLLTIKDCLRIIQFWQKAYREKSNEKEIKDLPQEEKIKGFSYYLNWELYGTQGERYRHKKERIEEMVEENRKKQDFYDNISEPSNISCNSCGKRLYTDTKILEDFMDKPMKVLFYFSCKTCKEKRAVYNTGEEFISKPSLCPKCGHELEETHTIKKSKNKVIIWKRKCSACKFADEEIDDFEKKHLEWEKEKQKDKELLEKYRKEFCLSDEKGQEYIELVNKMKIAHEVFEEEKQRYDNPVYQRSIQLKKIEIVELEKLLSELFEKERYIKLSFDKPEIGQYVIVPFTVQDADSSRKGFDSSNNLQKIVKNALEDTNWRLVSNSLSYRLGYVSGQLKGYEHEEDMLELAGKKKEHKPPLVRSEMRSKYEYDNLVQLARMMGKHEGIENMRKSRLEKEPDGFFLEASEGPYNCGICGELTQGNNTWWNLDGLRCRDCWRNIQEGIIPSIKHRYDNDGVYFQDWQLNSDFSLHSSTARKLKREGLLHGRELKRQDGSIYCTIYLIGENKEFLKKYPKKPKMKVEFINTGDKKVQL
ncbi:MAG: hypothetical protein M1366_01115 [Patescibacteria group bacterium]|nr:hypothetical protein [Patescibacteria group bacterium]